ncbi:MAG TPA: signal peptide peptidase SppA [Candidatus Dorea intestinavium]|nr:signal peptide peptidase SppA [Candidatus Dorea intestinavium]
MQKKQIWGIIIAVLLFVLVGVSSVLTNSLGERIKEGSKEILLAGDLNFVPPKEDYIAVVKVEGTIQEQTQTSVFSEDAGYQHTSTLDYIDELIKDDFNQGILLYVDSPGGTVYESEELYDKLMSYKEKTKRPIWDYMAHYAASGGYMASVTADKIYANQNTTTGSIGVILAGYDMTGLYEKLGIKYYSVTSGPFKDGSKITDELMAIYQSQVDELYQSFVDKVALGRDMSVEEVKKVADGRVYTATQAKEKGLIDEIGSLDELKKAMSKHCKTDVYYELSNEISPFSKLFADAKKLIPKSESQVLLEESEKLESGVPMYYAQ